MKINIKERKYICFQTRRQYNVCLGLARNCRNQFRPIQKKKKNARYLLRNISSQRNAKATHYKERRSHRDGKRWGKKEEENKQSRRGSAKGRERGIVTCMFVARHLLLESESHRFEQERQRSDSLEHSSPKSDLFIRKFFG